MHAEVGDMSVAKRTYRKKELAEIKLLTPEEIEKRRIPVVEKGMPTHASEGLWQCNYCENKFHSEVRFMKHFCEPKRRANTLSSPQGQAAFAFYRDWMKARKFGQPSAAAFLDSKYYRAFVNFAKHIADANISRPDKYLELMVEIDMMPSMWCSSAAYTIYTAWFDSQHDPIEQVSESIGYLLTICEAENVQLPNIFQHLGVQRILSYVRQRRLSPWFLFCSAAFGKILKQLDSAHIKAFDTVVNSSYWGEKFKKEQATLEQIKIIVKEMGL